MAIKDKEIRFRVTSEQLQKITALAETMNMNVSEFMRYLALNLADKVKQP
jgi:uncharacterized protein (DUF1778 family)